MNNQEASIPEIKKILADCFTPKASFYWTDFICSISLAWFSFFYVTHCAYLSLLQISIFIFSVVTFYRAILFIHELTHLRHNALPHFEFVWNMLCGFPMQIPSFMYKGVHLVHHSRAHYGTKVDGEYLPMGINPPYQILFYLISSALAPLLLVIRFSILTPLSYLHPKFRIFVLTETSSLSIAFPHKRELLQGKELKELQKQELLCFCYVLLALVLTFSNFIAWTRIIQWFLTSICISVLNAMRTLAAHRYRNTKYELNTALSHEEQFLDSVNISTPAFLHSIITELWAPVGLRYHALHHLFPTIPYHNLGKAHVRLLATLPQNSFYFQSTEKSLWHTLKMLWLSACRARSSTPVYEQGKDGNV